MRCNHILISIIIAFSLAACGQSKGAKPLKVRTMNDFREDLTAKSLAAIRKVSPHVTAKHLSECRQLAKMYGGMWGGSVEIIRGFKPSLQHTCAADNFWADTTAAYVAVVRITDITGDRGKKKPFACNLGLSGSTISVSLGKIRGKRSDPCHFI